MMKPMLHEPNHGLWPNILMKNSIKAEFILLLFIILFALFGLLSCFVFTNQDNKNLSYIAPTFTITTELT